MTIASLPLPTPVTVARRVDDGERARRSGVAATDQATEARRRRRPSPAMTRQLARFCLVGVTSTAFQLGLYLLLRGVLGPLSANLVALVVSNVANTAANRRFTFGIAGKQNAARHHLQGIAVFGLSLALTSAALGLLDLAAPAAPQSAELIVLMAANLLGTVARFALMRGWVFRPETASTHIPPSA
jgi:putative flippase GtrA